MLIFYLGILVMYLLGALSQTMGTRWYHNGSEHVTLAFYLRLTIGFRLIFYFVSLLAVLMVNPPTKQLPPSRPFQKSLRPPGSKLGDFLWRIEMWIWTAFPFSVLEPWEAILLRACSLSAFASMYLTIFYCYSIDTVCSLRINSRWVLQISSPTTSIHAATNCILPLGT